MRHLWLKDLRDAVFAPLDHLLRDLLPQFDSIERFVLCQPAEDRQLRAKHVAIGYGGDDFLGRGFDLLHRLR